MSLKCGRCGSFLALGARFCASCGSPTDVRDEASAERRKVVTVLFADIAGSTAINERLDPEAVRTLLGRHFQVAREALEGHGATVEKFIGDAAMAVFGIPELHEDDALRAVRAALDLQAGIAALNESPGAPASIGVRIGVNTGEVVAGDPSRGETLVTGDAVNVAARLEQAARVGEVLIGPETYALVRDAVTTEPALSLELKGKADVVSAYRVTAVAGDLGRRRNLEAQLVGRDAELAELRKRWAEVRDGNGFGLITMLAPAGVGKSRLVREFADAADAHVLRGRCLAYGDGITYWPIREILLGAAGVTEVDSSDAARAALEQVVADDPSGELLARRLEAAIGVADESAPQEEIFWAIRRCLELLAARRPLLLVVEDIHWAEPTLLDLLDYLADMGSGPILLVATARPELREGRPGWGSGANRQLMHLEPLGSEDSQALLLAQPGGPAISSDLRGRILAAAEGNALYVEEMLAMLRDSGRLEARDGGWFAADGTGDIDVPPTVRALLAARLDHLPPDERTITSHAAVVGRSFEAAALSELTPRTIQPDLGRRLLALVRKELLRPDAGHLTPGDAFRFRHVLIRDAAYAMLAKSDRARLHERFADWLEAVAGERIGEFEEIVAHHLEQALMYRHELGGDPGGLQERAASWMLRAGLRASGRDDSHAATTALRKAAQLGRGMYHVEAPALAALSDLYQIAGAFPEAEEVIARALEIAERAGNDRDAALARLNRVFMHRHTDPSTWVTEAIRDAHEAIPIFEAAGDDLGLTIAWHALALATWHDTATSREAEERAIDHARAAGDRRWLGWTLVSRRVEVVGDDTPLAEAIPVVVATAAEVAGLGSLFEATVALELAVLEAMAGRYEDAVSRAEAARELHRQFNHRMELALSAQAITIIHFLGGNFDRAEPSLREAISFLDGIGESDLGPYLCAQLARCLAWQGRYDEAKEFIEQAKVDDVDPVVETLWRSALSRVLAAAGDQAASIEEAERAVRGTPTIAPTRRATLLLDLAHALEAAGRLSDAAAALDEARLLAERKGNVALVAIIDQGALR